MVKACLRSGCQRPKLECKDLSAIIKADIAQINTLKPTFCVILCSISSFSLLFFSHDPHLLLWLIIFLIYLNAFFDAFAKKLLMGYHLTSLKYM